MIFTCFDELGGGGGACLTLYCGEWKARTVLMTRTPFANENPIWRRRSDA